MTIELPEKLAEELKAMLRRRGENDEVGAYVLRTLQRAVLFGTVDAIRERNRHVPPEELQSIIDEAVTEVRSARRQQERAGLQAPETES